MFIYQDCKIRTRLKFDVGYSQLPCLALSKGQCEKQAGKFTCCAVGKGTQRDSPNLVWWADGLQLLSELVQRIGRFLAIEG